MTSKAKTPPPPDYKALAIQQAEIDKAAVEAQTKANRVNQVGPYGSQTWGQDEQGNWTQTQSYNPEYQAMLDKQMNYSNQLTDTAGGMLGNVKDALGQPIDFSGLTKPDEWQGAAVPGTENLQDWGSLDFSDNPELADSGFGAVEQVRDAMMSRLQPGLEQGNAAEVARLKSQGITEGSPAWQAAMQSQGQRANDANQQALLGAAGEYGNIFNRSLQARQLANTEDVTSAEYANSLRGQQWGESKDIFGMGNTAEGLERSADTQDYERQLKEMLMKRSLPLEEYNKLMGSAGENPDLTFGSFFNEARANGPDIAGAADKSYAAEMEAAAAKAKAKAGMLSTVGSIAGSFFGPLGTAAGGMLGTALAGKAPVAAAAAAPTRYSGDPNAYMG